jgi:ectoine hydroxylase-related dioxygenase (phytanoyl-CoA dioxygenase family)
MPTVTQAAHPRRPGFSTRPPTPPQSGVFGPAQLDQLESFFRAEGYAILRGVFAEATLIELDADMAARQADLVAGLLPTKHGTVILDEPDAMIDGQPFAHYVCQVTECSDLSAEAVTERHMVDTMHRLLGPDAWLLEDDRFGVVFQDARPGDHSGYSRIGWHSDWQSGPHLDLWPSVAFTIHLDGTSPANGFLRVVPRSHLGGTDEMPLGFEKVTGEVAVYAERGDVIFHDAHLWHSAARATDDGQIAIRRHIRGGWFGGRRLPPNHGLDDFVKNARR